MHFLGLSTGDRVPDAKTIWLFKNQLSRAGAMKPLFSSFNRQLEAQHFVTQTGIIVDATFVDAPSQRNTREENKIFIKQEVF